MMPLVVVLTLSAVVTLLLGGYLFGARAGREVRSTLLEERDARGARVAELEARLASAPREEPREDRVKSELARMLAPLLEKAKADPTADVLRRDMQSLTDSVAARERNNDAFRDEMRTLLTSVASKAPDPGQIHRDMQRMSALLAQREDGTGDVRRMMNEVLSPMLDRERALQDLASIHVGAGGLGELPKLLDAIADKAGFSTVVLSDEAGLPLAASAGASEVELLAGTAAFFVTLAERAERAAAPRPLSCVVLDETNRTTVHRMFTVGASRFTLSAVSRGLDLSPGALDPALSPLERALTRTELS